MAPEQGPDSKSKAEKLQKHASDEESVLTSDNSKSDTLSKDCIGWIYLLKKEQLVEHCRSVGIPTAGYTVEFLRKKLAEAIRTKHLRASTENLLREVENEVRQSENTIIQDEPITIPKPSSSRRPVVPDADIMCTVQKWNLRFSGDSDLMEFLERIEELAECYQIHTDQLLPAMLGVLSGNALKWYRVKRTEIQSWAEFRNEIQKFFLPKRFLSQIEQNFYNRRQNNRERAKDFILSMLTLARQHPDLRGRDHLDRIYDGLRSEYRHYVRRGDFSSLDELISMTDDFEALKREERPQPTHTIIATKYDRRKVCWRCKQTGHRRNSCTFERRLFCSYCGRDGTFSISCGCRETRIEKPTEEDIRYHIVITINGLKVQSLIDTGASKTYINKRVANHLIASDVPHITSQGVTQMADKSLANFVRVFDARITFKNKNIPLHLSEIPTLAEDMILGMDFLTAYGVELRLGGEIIPTTNTNLHSFTSRDLLISEENSRLQALSEKHQTAFSTCNKQCTPAEHVIRLKHNKPIKQYLPRNPAMMKRKTTKPANTKKSVKPRVEKPVPYRPPLKARPRQQNPPLLNYIMGTSRSLNVPLPARVTTNATVTAPTCTIQQPQHTSIPPTPAAEQNQQKPQPSVSSNPTTPSPEISRQNPQPSVSSVAAQPTTEATSKSPSDTKSEKTLLGITVTVPKKYIRHSQYVLRRPKLPPVKVTVLNKVVARQRCQGHEKVIRMTDSDGNK